MKSLDNLIDTHSKLDKTRNSLSNLIKKIKLDSEFFNYIENLLDFGTFKQKLYHYANDLPNSKLLCQVCNKNNLNWVETDNKYRTTCSSRCSGKLTGTKNNINKTIHPNIETNVELIEYFNRNKIKLVESSLSKIYPDLVKSINSKVKFKTNTYSEKVYFYLNNFKKIPLCNKCNKNKVSYKNFSKGYNEYCSVKCSSNSDIKKEKIKQTCLKKYGIQNISIITRNKASDTMFKKYGGHISTTTQYKEKYKETSIKKYGSEHPFKSEKIKKKIKATFLKKYGVSNPMKVSKIIKKNLKTKKDKGAIFKWTETELKDIRSYRRSVSYYTEKTYNEYRHLINPDNLERGINKYHIDHIYPVIEGWKNKILPIYIANYKNIRLVTSYDNLAKGDKTEISYEEFIKNITKC
jgi:hypothetical protein